MHHPFFWGTGLVAESDGAVAYHMRADACLGRGDAAGAIAALTDGLSDDPKDFNAWIKLAALKRGGRDLVGAMDAVNHALDVRPNDFLALLLKGSLHEQSGEALPAAEMFRAAIHLAAAQSSLPPPVLTQLAHARNYVARYRAKIEDRLPDIASHDPRYRGRRTRFLDNVMDRRAVYHQEPTHYRYPGLSDVEFFDDAYPAFRETLRAAFPAIRDEFLALMDRHADRQQPYVNFAAGQPVGPWRSLNRSPAWNALHLERYGERDAVNAGACPRTMAAFADAARANIPGLAPNLMFSLLRPGTHIPPHHGVANFRSVLHLPLIVPDGCRFRVGGETRLWREGEPLMFDDTIEHEARNDGDALRVVVIADVWRPELDEIDRQIVRDVVEAQEDTAVVAAL